MKNVSSGKTKGSHSRHQRKKKKKKKKKKKLILEVEFMELELELDMAVFFNVATEMSSTSWKDFWPNARWVLIGFWTVFW